MPLIDDYNKKNYEHLINPSRFFLLDALFSPLRSSLYKKVVLSKNAMKYFLLFQLTSISREI